MILLDTLDEADWIKTVTLARHGTLDTIAGLREPSRRHYGPGDHPNGSPQSIHGSGGGSTPLAIAKQGGDSLQPATGRRPTKGYMVAKPPKYGVIVSAERWFDEGDEILADFVDERIADFKADPDLFVGVWWDRAHEEFALDESLNVFDLDEAIAKARAWDQQAIWDVVNLEEIPTGGTGGRSATSGHQAAEGLGEDDPRGEARLGSRGRDRDRQGWQDQEVAAALRAFYLRHYGPGDHPNGSPQTVHASGALSGGSTRLCKPITSESQLDVAQRKSLAQIWEPWTRRRQATGEKVVVHVDRQILKDHIEGVIRGATPEQVAKGKAWYQEAHDFSMELAEEFDVEPRVAVGVVAALSPNTGWEANKTKARNALARFKSGEYAHLSDGDAAVAMNLAFKSDAIQAVQIMRNPDAAFAAGLPSGPKRGSFVNNIYDPTNDFDVTVDGWVTAALQRSSHGMSEADGLAWLGRSTDQAKTTGLVVKHKGYIAVADLMREIASEMDMTPAQAQAVYWVAVGGGEAGNKMWEGG